MATLESWAVDLADIEAIYPWVGAEGLLVVAGVAFWIGWHIWQIKSENKIIADEEERVREHPELVHWVRRQD